MLIAGGVFFFVFYLYYRAYFVIYLCYRDQRGSGAVGGWRNKTTVIDVSD